LTVKQVAQDEQGIGARPPGSKAKHCVGQHIISQRHQLLVD
jgi:hypothetical protein